MIKNAFNTAFKAALAESLSPDLYAPEPWPEVRKVLRENLNLNGGGSHVLPQDLNAAILAANKCTTSDDVDALPFRTRRTLIESLWVSDTQIYLNDPLMNYLKERLADGRLRNSEMKGLARSMLRQWTPNLPHFEWMLKTLDQQKVSLPNAILKLASWGAFQPSGPKLLASHVFKNRSKSIEATLFDSGITTTLQQSNYASEAFNYLCELVQADPTDQNYNRLLDYAISEGEIRFPGRLQPLVRACLRPWHKNKSPTAELKKRLMNTLRDALGDPRFNPAKWVQVDEQDIRIMRRWLASESLQVFLDIVDETAVDRMWRYRRAFWEACFEKNIIDDAWVAFGPTAHASFKHQVRQGYLPRSLMCAKLRGAEGSQSVLMMKVGETTLIEWSHNGKIWILDPVSELRAPQLYSSNYDASNLRGFGRLARFETSHTAPESWNWQYKVAGQLKQMTGVRIQQYESMP